MTPRVRPLLREITAEDAGRILDFTRRTGVFRDEELLIAEEVLLASAAEPVDAAERPYYSLGAELEGRLVGWICWGPTPCTVGTWDLYWLAVDPAAQGAGVGTALVEEMERRLARRARLIVIDTSGRPDYDPTRAFYEAKGYERAAVVRDFYAAGDDQVIYRKKFEFKN